MPETMINNLPQYHDAFREHERQVRISTGRLACWLVIVLMPVGTLADWKLYPNQVVPFLALRLVCSALVMLVWLLHWSSLAKRYYPAVGMPIVLLPSFVMVLMIYLTHGVSEPELAGVASPYYAALNLILLAVSAVGHWSVGETLFAVGSVICLYLGFAVPILERDTVPVFFINVYFLVLTGIIVVAGNFVFNRLRFREFALRLELDSSRKQLEENNRKLDGQNQELADTIQKLTEAESQLVQSEKMASLGRMSAGIIHEINNPLNFATTSLFTLRKKAKHIATEQQADYEDTLKDVEDGITRVKNIVSDLRMFTHPSTDDQDEVDAAEVVASAMRFLSNELKDKVNIEQKLIEHQTVQANKNKLIHVFVNLIQNSLDALRNKPFNNGEKPTIWIEGRVENGLSCLIVRDNGPGIANEHLDKIFDPFFTTKEVGEGMGLGLSICYRIMQENQGRISVKTEVGKFSEFTLEFPVKA